MKKPFERPQMHVVSLPDVPEGTDLASLSDDELLALLEKNHFEEQKRCYKASENYISREIAGQMVLVPMDGAQLNGMIAMSPSGAFLMELMREERTQADLAYALEKKYGIGNETALCDAGAFLNKALRDGLVVAC